MSSAASNALKRFAPLLDRVLVERIVLKPKSSVLIPESALPKNNEAVVLAVGPGFRNKDGTFTPTGLKAGDRVYLPEYGGQKLVFDDKEVFLFRADDILGVLKDEKSN